jgi:p-aminobenzoyl-glutamate transporter AbgT
MMLPSFLLLLMSSCNCSRYYSNFLWIHTLLLLLSHNIVVAVVHIIIVVAFVVVDVHVGHGIENCRSER